MSERDNNDTPGSGRSRLVKRVDEELFAAWKAEDPAARTEAWNRLWTATYSWAAPYCRSMAPDAFAADEWAAEAIFSALADVERRLRDEFSWQGEPQFAGMFSNYVRRRCIDRCRAFMRLAAREADEGREQVAGGRPDRSPSVPAMQEDDTIGIAGTVAAIGDIAFRLAWQREICAERPALAEIMEAKQAYLRECCVRAVVGLAVPDADAMRLDDLVPLIDRCGFDASSPEMNEFIMNRLGIDRMTLDNRLREIRKLLRRVQSGEADDTDRPGAR